MTDTDNLDVLEQAAYRDAYSDGIVDLFTGLSLLWIGTAWIWLSDIAGMAGVLPAVFISVVLTGRKKFVEDRAGYVKWSPPRREWEKRNLVLLLVAGIAMFALGVIAYVVASSGSDTGFIRSIGPGLLAFLLALTAAGLGIAFGARRLFAYAAMLMVGGIAAAWQDTSPGWPLLAAGVVVAGMGGYMLLRYAQANPSVRST